MDIILIKFAGLLILIHVAPAYANPVNKSDVQIQTDYCPDGFRHPILNRCISCLQFCNKDNLLSERDKKFCNIICDMNKTKCPDGEFYYRPNDRCLPCSNICDTNKSKVYCLRNCPEYLQKESINSTTIQLESSDIIPVPVIALIVNLAVLLFVIVAIAGLKVYMRHHTAGSRGSANDLLPLGVSNPDKTKTTSVKLLSKDASKEILRDIKKTVSYYSSSNFNIIDVNFEEQSVDVRYCLKAGSSKFKDDLPAFEKDLRQTCMPHGYRPRLIPIADIPFCELTRKGGIGSSIATMDQQYAVRGSLSCCAGAFVDIRDFGVHFLTTAHSLSVGKDVWFKSDTSSEVNSRGSLGEVKKCLLVHEFEGYPETTDVALIKLNPSNNLKDHFNTTVNIAGVEKGISYRVEDAESGRTVVKICNQQLLLRGQIVKTNYSRFHAPEFYRCIVIKHYNDSSQIFHVPGESGMLVAYEASPPLHNMLIGVGMLMARYQENHQWYSVVVPLQRTLDRLKDCDYVGGHPISLMPSLYFNSETHMFDVPRSLLTGPEFNHTSPERNHTQNLNASTRSSVHPQRNKKRCIMM